ncbi:MAG: hypothetical protein R2932_30900 [Caldilineaceae bacterium]
MILSAEEQRVSIETTQQQANLGISGASSAINQLLAAAVINKKFRHMLLTNPRAALAAGYQGESFTLSPAEKELVLQIKAATLQEFAEQLVLATTETAATTMM